MVHREIRMTSIESSGCALTVGLHNDAQVHEVQSRKEASMEHITESAREKVQDVLARVEKAELSTGVRSKPLLGLPVKRIIPQDVHSLVDYAGGATGLVAALCANTVRGRMVNTALSSASTGVSLLTDYKLSLAKVIPIEVHEAIDYVWGLSNVVAPFALGYYRKDRVVSIMQMVLGMGTIAASLITDYRAYSRSNGRSNGTRTESRPRVQHKRRATKKK
jgi:hypothetical protein